MKAAQTVFKTVGTAQFGTQTNGIIVANITNKYHNQMPKVYIDPGVLYSKIEKGGMLKAFKQTFNDDRLKQLLHDRGIDITLFISPLGKVFEVEYLINQTNLVTPAELEQLENAIKNDVLFKINQDDTKGTDFFRVSLVVKYKNVLNGIER